MICQPLGSLGNQWKAKKLFENIAILDFEKTNKINKEQCEIIVCDFAFVLMAHFHLQAFLLHTSIKVHENVIPDSFRSMFFGGFSFPG